MADYDFKTLNDKEFEIFCADLLSDVHGVRFERFKPGRDSGVDGRYFRPDKGEVVLQCKHWANTPTDHLIRALRSKEQPKLDKLKPARYVLAVSNALSRADKSAIRKALAPYVSSDSDILGKEDLNDLLKSRPEIERRHYKLWLCSATVISHILNKPIFERSAFSLEEAIEAARKYVTTANHAKAIDMLERLRVVIITGEPGVGKTTLAEHLCLHYVSEGFQFIKMVEEIGEAEAVFGLEKKQIFYFDDFLGKNYLEAVNGHEGSHIVQFMRRVNKSANVRLVLTSRSTILNQGKVLIDSFRHQKMERNEYELTVASLSEMDKAHILYNHIWHSSLTQEFIEALYKDKRYRTIIGHKNYNPRLISFITDSSRVEDLKPEEYWSYIERTLANPTEVWDNPFIAQQDDFGRAIVLLVALSGKPTAEDVLAEAYSRFVARPANAGLKGHRDFLINIRHLTGSLINRRISKNADGLRPMLELFNPSLGDYLLRRYAADIPTLNLGFLSLRTLSSVGTIENLLANEIITAKAGRIIVRSILTEAVSNHFVGYTGGYIASVARLMIRIGIPEGDFGEPIDSAVKFIAAESLPANQESAVRVIAWAIERGLLGAEVAFRVVVEACERDESDESELKALSELLGCVKSEGDAYSDAAKKFDRLVVDYLSNTIAEDVSGEETFADVAYEDYEEARVKVEALIVRRLEHFGADVADSAVREILNYYDYEYELARYYENMGDDRPHEGGSFVVPSDGIDDLFDRG